METVDFLGNKWLYECMGCSIANREIDLPGGILYENKHFQLHQDPNNPIPGFLIISLKRHTNNIAYFTQDEINDFTEILHKTRYILNLLNKKIIYTIIQEERSPHFHLWLLPKYDWMEDIYNGRIDGIIPLLKYGKENWKTAEMVGKTLEMAMQIKELMNK